MNAFPVSRLDVPTTLLAGMSVVTCLERTSVDCPALWQSFGPRIVELPPPPAGASGAYGISVMLTDTTFEYRAAVETGPVGSLPEGLAPFTLPGGLYAQCTVPHLGALQDAYRFLFETWLPAQEDCRYNPDAPTFERYPPDWRLESPFTIHAGLLLR
ncbi:GyrI-like domain-containing protein [Phaeovibrio sulfidiphilus]|uniref:GyrI-like domain-containing protein n=1 Tax=Phaeovibrio sulfidiphilus TaxID=1220600 RepID=A0A8J7CVB7_9PROT|nr:GyrI-like domain-containing protein [Phaeovibrio sulfidiphilus]MBE1236106.1 GyrI-like domain-containing protein [Phaeovibrio sulfidiphilus]